MAYQTSQNYVLKSLFAMLQMHIYFFTKLLEIAAIPVRAGNWTKPLRGR
jgi:hypothetical protein